MKWKDYLWEHYASFCNEIPAKGMGAETEEKVLQQTDSMRTKRVKITFPLASHYSVPGTALDFVDTAESKTDKAV